MFKNGPGKRVCEQEMRKEAGDVVQFVGLEPVDRVVLLLEGLREGSLVCSGEHAELLRDQPVRLAVGNLLAAAVDYHVDKLHFQAGLNLQLKKLVARILVRQRGHDCQVDRATKLHKLCLRGIHNLPSGRGRHGSGCSVRGFVTDARVLPRCIHAVGAPSPGAVPRMFTRARPGGRGRIPATSSTPRATAAATAAAATC